MSNTPLDGPAQAPASGLVIAGLTRLSVCDWPGRLVATVFLQGCGWRCGYCHNPDLIDPKTPGTISWDQVRAHLLARRGLLDAVVFSGGEPTLQRGLPRRAEEVQALGYQVGLHTGGGYPQQLAALLPGLNWVGLDIKGLPEEYSAITGVGVSAARAFASLELVLAHAAGSADFDFEVRTTLDPRFHTAAGVLKLIDELQSKGVRKLVLQEVRYLGGGPAAPAAELFDQLGDLPAGVSRRSA